MSLAAAAAADADADAIYKIKFQNERYNNAQVQTINALFLQSNKVRAKVISLLQYKYLPWWWSKTRLKVLGNQLIIETLLTNSNFGGARGVMVIVIGNEHGDKISNPGRDLLHFT